MTKSEQDLFIHLLRSEQCLVEKSLTIYRHKRDLAIAESCTDDAINTAEEKVNHYASYFKGFADAVAFVVKYLPPTEVES